MTDAWGARSDAATFGRVAAALAAADSEHLPVVVDVAALGERRELLLAEAGGPTLTAVRATRRLAPAEAVTVVVSAARAVAALHAAGHCGVGLDDDELRFDAAARPIVFGLGEVRETIHAGAERREGDWRAVAALAERLGLLAQSEVGAVLGAQQVGLGLALAAVTARESPEHLAQLEDALFDIAEPAPVRLDATPALASHSSTQLHDLLPAAADTTAQQSPGPRAAAAAERAASRSRALHRRPSSSVLIEAFDAGPAALLAGPLERLRQLGATSRSRLQGRTRVILVASTAAAVLTVALVALLPGSPRSEDAGRAVPAAESVAPSNSAATASSAETAGAALAGTDPVAAAAVLIARRDSCLAGPPGDRDGCLAKVADGGASALDQPARPLAGLTPSLLEHSGDSALIALTPTTPKTAPASALLMRTETGWRLRQLYEN